MISQASVASRSQHRLSSFSLTKYGSHGCNAVPQQGIVLMISQAPVASRSQHRLSSFLLTNNGSHGCNAVGCANTNDHRPTNTRSSFPAPEAVPSEVEQRFGCVQAQTHMYPSLVGRFHSHPEPNSSPTSLKSYLLHRQDSFAHRGAASLGPLG